MPWFFLALVVVVAGCSEDPSAPDVPSNPFPNESPPGWVKLLDQPVRARDVHTFAADQIVALGVNGHISRFDGQRWQMTDPLGGWGMHALWGTAPDDLIMVGFKGRIVRYDGRRWRDEDSGTQATLEHVWGRGPQDVYVVGEDGTILHKDGAGWHREDSGTSRDLHGIHGTADGHVFAVGVGGSVLHKAPGGAWSPIPTQSSADLNDVWAASADWLVAVGEAQIGGRLILERVGEQWTATASTPGGEHLSVSGTSPSEVWAVGQDGAWSWNGSDWNLEDNTGAYAAVQFAPDGTLVLQSDRDAVSVRDRGSWQMWDCGFESLSVSRLWGVSDTDLLVTYYFGALLRYDGQAFVVQQDAPTGLRDVWGSPDGQNIYFVGDGSRILTLKNGSFEPVHQVQSGARLSYIFGVGDELFVGGELGWVSHFDGAQWTDAQLATPFRNRYIHGLDGSAADQVYAITTDSVYRFDGEQWVLFHEFGDGYFLKNIVVMGPDEIYVEGSFEFGATGFYVDLYYFDGTQWLRPLRSSRYVITELTKAPEETVVGAGTNLGSGAAGFVLRGRQEEWSIESVETGRPGGFDHVWVSDTGRIYLDDGDLWVSEDYVLPASTKR